MGIWKCRLPLARSIARKNFAERGVLAAEDVALAEAASFHRQDVPLDHVLDQDVIADVDAAVQQDGHPAAVVVVDQPGQGVALGEMPGPVHPGGIDDDQRQPAPDVAEGVAFGGQLARLVVGQAALGDRAAWFRCRFRRAGWDRA